MKKPPCAGGPFVLLPWTLSPTDLFLHEEVDA